MNQINNVEKVNPQVMTKVVNEYSGSSQSELKKVPETQKTKKTECNGHLLSVLPIRIHFTATCNSFPATSGAGSMSCQMAE